MAQIIYGRFADKVFRDTASVEDWREMPRHLRTWAVLWRDGADLRSLMSQATFYRTRKALAAWGFDVSTPCNIQALTRVVRQVEVRQVSALAA